MLLCVIQDELINHVVLPHMCHIENDGDVAVRKCAVEILLSLAQTCSPLCFIDLVDIVEKVRLQYYVSYVEVICCFGVHLVQK